MNYYLKIKTGFFKKEPVEINFLPTRLVLKTISDEYIITQEDLVSIDVINALHFPELDIHTKNNNYTILLENLSKENDFYENLSRIFKNKFKL